MEIDLVVEIDPGRRLARFVAPLVERVEVERDPFTRRERTHDQRAEALELLVVEESLLVELEHREEPHDDLELLVHTDDQLAEIDRALVGQ